MLRLSIFLLLLIASVWLGVEVVKHPGYLLLYYQPWMVQMPIWFVMVSLIVIFGLFYFIVDSLDRLSFLWYRIKNWFRIRREHKSYSQTQHGLTLLIEGRWKKAEGLLLAGLKQSYEPLMNYLGAAKAAHEQGAFVRRDQYLQSAYKEVPDADLAIGLTQAEFDLAQHQYEHAIATLNHLRQSSPRHPRILSLLEKAYVHLGDWKKVKDLLPAMRKAKMISADQFEIFEKNIYREMLNSSNDLTEKEINDLWNDVPRSAKKNPEVVYAYAKQLIRLGANKEAAEYIRKTLKYMYQPELVTLYGNLPLENLNRQLVIVGAWLEQYGQKPELLLTLGKICERIQLWGKAKDYFERCLKMGPNSEASLEYGKLLEQLGESDAATRIYRDGLQSVK